MMSNEKVIYSSVALTDKNEDPPDVQIVEAPKGFGARHVQALLLFTSLSVGYAMRAHLSVVMVAMTSESTLQLWYPNVTYDCLNLEPVSNASFVNRTNLTTLVESEMSEACIYAREKLTSSSVYRIYKWDKPTQEMILFSFFLGYTFMMLPMGVVAQRWGGKLPIVVGLGANGVLSILTPWMAMLGGWLGVSVSRLLQGCTQAAFYPSIHTLLGRWAPPNEIGRLNSYIYTGSQFGTVVAFQLSGLLAGSAALGWPASFWFCGVLSLVCCALLGYYGAASPHDHPSISRQELAYILGSGHSDQKPKRQHTPWRSILSSLPVWGIVASHAGSSMGYLFILTQTPLYINRILGVKIKENGVLSSLPYVSMYVMSLLFGHLADMAMNRNVLSVVNVRRVSNTIGMVVAGVFLVGFGYVTSTWAGVLLLVLCLGSHSGVHLGFHVNIIDLAPNFAGPIMSLSNMVANLSSLIVPVLVSNIVGNDVGNQNKWQILFWIFAAIQAASNLFYVLVAKGEVALWNFHEEDKNETEKELQVLNGK